MDSESSMFLGARFQMPGRLELKAAEKRFVSKVSSSPDAINFLSSRRQLPLLNNLPLQRRLSTLPCAFY